MKTTETQTNTQTGFELPTKELLTAILLAFILFLLPSPADTLALPFIVQHFVMAFFDVVRLYPRRSLKNFVARNHAMLIFLAIFGAWYGFWNTAQNFLSPFWDTGRAYLYQYKVAEAWVTWIRFSWEAAPLIISVCLTIPGWLSLQRSLKEMVDKLTTE